MKVDTVKHKDIGAAQCPIARSLRHVGEWWSILILRDAFHGVTRFDQFQTSLGIAPNMLTRRLNGLVESGLLEKRLYSAKPARHEYVLTKRGRDFQPVLCTLVAWGNAHFAPEGPSLQFVDRETGAVAEPLLVDARTMRPLLGGGYRTAATPTAGDRLRARHGVFTPMAADNAAAGAAP